MDDRRPVLVHIGLHKTASSWLKTHVFRADPFTELLPVPELVAEVVRPQGLDYEPDRVRRLLEERLAALPADRRPCLATERLAGNPHAGSHDRYQIADRLVQTVPNPKFLMVFREQSEMLASLYYQYVRRGGSCRLGEYAAGGGDRKVPLFDLEVLEYDRLVAYYLDRVGADRVLALPYELLRDRPRDFASAILAFGGADPEGAGDLPLGARVNSRRALAETRVRRWFNAHLIRPSASLNQRSVNWTLLRPLDRPLGAVARRSPRVVERYLTAAQARQIEEMTTDRFRESNDRLAALIGRDLSSLGYATTSTSG